MSKITLPWILKQVFHVMAENIYLIYKGYMSFSYLYCIYTCLKKYKVHIIKFKCFQVLFFMTS